MINKTDNSNLLYKLPKSTIVNEVGKYLNIADMAKISCTSRKMNDYFMNNVKLWQNKFNEDFNLSTYQLFKTRLYTKLKFYECQLEPFYTLNSPLAKLNHIFVVLKNLVPTKAYTNSNFDPHKDIKAIFLIKIEDLNAVTNQIAPDTLSENFELTQKIALNRGLITHKEDLRWIFNPNPLTINSLKLIYNQYSLQLNKIQKKALKMLKPSGINATHFINKKWFKSTEHLQDLVALLKSGKQLTEALQIQTQINIQYPAGEGLLSKGIELAEISKLYNKLAIVDTITKINKIKALKYFMSKFNNNLWKTEEAIEDFSNAEINEIFAGLTYDEIIGLDNFPQVSALGKYKKYGLTADHLLSCNTFTTHSHEYALEILLTNKHLPISEAIKEIKDLNENQVHDLSNLSREEILKLPNKIHRRALASFRSDGLDAETILTSGVFNSLNHLDIFWYLLDEKGRSITEAISELKGLNQIQVSGLLCNLSREESLLLSNDYQVEALQLFKQHQLRISHILTCETFNSQWHLDALTYLIKHNNKTVEAAIDVLKGLNQFQAQGIAQGWSREIMQSFTHDFHIKAFLAINSLTNMRASIKQIISCSSEHHTQAFIYLINEKSLAAEIALKELTALSKNQIKEIAAASSKKENKF